jgi:hypothetical protein
VKIVKLEKTLKVLRQISSVSDPGPGLSDALLVGDIELTLKMLLAEISRLPDDEIEPRLLLALSRFYQRIGKEDRSLSMFRRAAQFTDQNRGFYTDLGFCAVELCRESASAEFTRETTKAAEKLLNVCPFPEDLKLALGRTQ